MKNLMKKIRGNKKGFTLAELLVVVAIVGILVAISIPVFTAQLGKARRATNNANLRAAKAAAVAAYLTDDTTNAGSTKFYAYNISEGSVADPAESLAGGLANENEVTIGKDKNGNNETDAVSSSKVYDTIWVKISGAANAAGDQTNEKVTLYAK